ncbi:MAG: serine hydrolase domain-containing protein [Pseudomonadota bacterium]
MMRRCCLALCIALTATGSLAQDDNEPGRLARVQALLPEVDKRFADLAAAEHLPGVVYGVILDGKLVHARAQGYANLEEKIPVTLDTQFRIASMSKSFVCLAALKLRDQGKLGLDDPVAKYLPELSTLKLPTSDSPTLTVRMLMTMTTGLPEDNPWGDRQMDTSNAELAKFVGAGLSFSSAPGTVFEYSNLGYALLGKVVGKASGMRFQDYITRQILQPLGMTSTIWEYASAPPARLALGYHWRNNAWQREPMLHDGDAAALGGLLTSMTDFSKYAAFLMDAWPARDGADSGPLKRSSVRELQQPRVFSSFAPKATLVGKQTPNPGVDFYGYGLRIARAANGTVVIGHGGGLPGFGSDFRFAPDHGLAVIAFSNRRYAPMSRTRLTHELIERAKLPGRSPVPAPILLRRQQQVAQLVQTWDERLGAEIAADNLFLDRSRADWIELSGKTLGPIGAIQSIGPIKAENRLRGAFPIVGERGTVNVHFTLTPEADPKVQEIELSEVQQHQAPGNSRWQ